MPDGRIKGNIVAEINKLGIVTMKQYNLIFLRRDKMLLSNKHYSNWQEIQDDYDDYMASVNFATVEEIEEYVMIDYKLSFDTIKDQVNKLNNTSSETIEIIL